MEITSDGNYDVSGINDVAVIHIHGGEGGDGDASGVSTVHASGVGGKGGYLKLEMDLTPYSSVSATIGYAGGDGYDDGGGGAGYHNGADYDNCSSMRDAYYSGKGGGSTYFETGDGTFIGHCGGGGGGAEVFTTDTYNRQRAEGGHGGGGGGAGGSSTPGDYDRSGCSTSGSLGGDGGDADFPASSAGNGTAGGTNSGSEPTVLTSGSSSNSGNGYILIETGFEIYMDSDQIKDITIDGTEVQDVTIDGNTL